MNGNTIVPMSQITTKYSSLTNLTANADEADYYFYTVNITGFSASNIAEGYIEVSLKYLGRTYTYSASVARAHNPVLVIKGSYIAGIAYSANYIQRDCVKYTDNNWYAARPTVGTTLTTWVPAEWEQLNSFKNVATDTLLAEEANIAGFIYQDEKMISQTGTINGDVSTNWSHKDFVPNIILDGVTGVASMRGATIQGTIDASDGVFDGVIGSSGKFTMLTSPTNPALKIGLSGTTEQFFIEGDVLHQGVSSDGYAYRFYGSNIYARGVFGSDEEATVLIENDDATYFPFGIGSFGVRITLSHSSSDQEAYEIQLYGSSGLIAGFPVNRVVFRNTSNIKYVLKNAVGKRVTLINANYDTDIRFYVRGVPVTLSGGSTREINFLGSWLWSSPMPTGGTLGYGIVLGASYNDTW